MQEYLAAHKLYREGCYAECLALVEGCSLEALLLRGAACFQLRQYMEAEHAFCLAASLDEDDVYATIALARCAYARGDPALAVQYCEAVLARGPHWLAYRVQGAAYYQLKEYGKAQEALFRAYDEHPSLETKVALSGVQDGIGDRDTAIETLHDVLAFAPETATALCALGELHLAQGSIEDAFACFTRAALATQQSAAAWGAELEESSISGPRFQLGEIFMRLGYLCLGDDPKVALQKFRVAWHTMGPTPGLWLQLGCLFVHLGRLPAALHCATVAFNADPLDERYRCLLGYIHLLRQDFSRAFQVLSALLGSSNASAHWMLGVAAAKLGEERLAFTCLDNAVAAGAYGAAAAGLILAIEVQDNGAIQRFTDALRRIEPDTPQNLRLVKATLKRVPAERLLPNTPEGCAQASCE
ncbi:TPR_1 Tetratricopeptide repeat protein [Giardia muris]|uniref:TPR_1 Tetratricopeptide repeat protein n=1 Tax=Giardia muris TaxID=5742 RepID=A0A4Z1T866_GIAMU|nr:TPR_1 Tetratricopeptide repeat protein [Giardia muris]|eukprot:TNJ29367.1 TPR_1 Tetratricopeptide repeat protein [Giardia muris]